ncbi:predicted protein [Histoplasma capsulatum H143]|uniref:Uncharacterized protein n=1 Tax=Ajellomyces capsulatus (strain H143) TaxID=544712 RepID=C6H781_AJECH|nr:predicted protein [Histoplasma capsulatum H143]
MAGIPKQENKTRISCFGLFFISATDGGDEVYRRPPQAPTLGLAIHGQCTIPSSGLAAPIACVINAAASWEFICVSGHISVLRSSTGPKAVMEITMLTKMAWRR